MKISNAEEKLPDPPTLSQNNDVKNKEVCTRVRLLMSLNQMMIHNYPLPTNKRQFTMEGYRFTKSHYSPVTDDSPMYAIDCEMCYTSIGRNELTRVSVINEQLEVCFFFITIYKVFVSFLRFLIFLHLYVYLSFLECLTFLYLGSL